MSFALFGRLLFTKVQAAVRHSSNHTNFEWITKMGKKNYDYGNWGFVWRLRLPQSSFVHHVFLINKFLPLAQIRTSQWGTWYGNNVWVRAKESQHQHDKLLAGLGMRAPKCNAKLREKWPTNWLKCCHLPAVAVSCHWSWELGGGLLLFSRFPAAYLGVRRTYEPRACAK